MNLSGLLSVGTKIEQLYNRFCEPVCSRYGLNQKGLDILLFLHANPACNTARDICEQRMMKSGIVSVTVETLIQSGYLRREQDGQDRRLQRLFLTPAAQAPVRQGLAALKAFSAGAFSRLSPQEQEAYLLLGQKVTRSIEEMSNSPRLPGVNAGGHDEKEIDHETVF